jgi:hypothetical protein
LCLSLALMGSATMADENKRQDRMHDEWVLLGQREVDRNLDRDIIRVDMRDTYSHIALRVDGPAVHIYRCKVQFKNGNSQDLSIDRTLRDGEMTPAMSLEGKHDRPVRQIDLTYKTVGRHQRGGALVSVYGLK